MKSILGEREIKMADLLKPRTLISLLLYTTFCILSIQGKIPSEAVVAAISTLLTFYYTSKIYNGKKVEEKK